MKKVYLLIYNSTLGTREEIKAWLNEMPQVETWRYEMPYSFYIISEAKVKEIGQALRERTKNPTYARFLVIDLSAVDMYGFIAADSWEFINAARIIKFIVKKEPPLE